MAGRLLPLFPLHVVVFPRTRLPLHIFEERYKEMVRDAIRDNSEFGIVLARDKGIINIGCTVAVEKVIKLYPDGRMDILTRGRRRFEILALDEEKDYLRAEVEFFDDDDMTQPPAAVRERALSLYETFVKQGGAEDYPEPDRADPQLSFQLAQSLPDPDFLSVLLRTRSEPARLNHYNDYLAQYLPRQRAIAHIREVAPGNGFGGRG